MINVSQTISGKYFSATIPDVVFTISGTSAKVVMAVDDDQIYSESLFPVDGVITIADLSELLTPYARRRLVFSLSIIITEQGTSSEDVEIDADIVFSLADVSTSCSDFCEKHFLSLLQGRKTTAIGRLEYLHYIGTDEATVVATYDDMTTKEFALVAVGGNSKYTTIDVSPEQFQESDRNLILYEVTAGERRQIFDIDLEQPDCAPIVIFENSFGVEELLYCTGTHKIAPTYKRESAYIGRVMKNYRIEETRSMTADTGILTYEEAQWAEDLFRSEYIRVVNFYDGEPVPGKEIVITDAKAERTNDLNELPRFTFTYQYAQRNHNVLDLQREGRIFDNTFDKTFN